jgi:hypothetical protein
MRVEISWDRVLEMFSSKYREVYHDSDSKKLHLSDGTVVDGPSDGWIPISILDAVCGMKGRKH